MEITLIDYFSTNREALQSLPSHLFSLFLITFANNICNREIDSSIALTMWLDEPLEKNIWRIFCNDYKCEATNKILEQL